MSPLTISYRRAEIVAFWIVATGVAWLLGVVAAFAMELRPSWLWGLAVALAIIAPGAFWTSWFEAGIWLWNGTVRRVTAVLRIYVLAVSYYTVFAAVGVSRSGFSGGPNSSRWLQTRRDELTASAPGPRAIGRAEWARVILQFVRVPGRAWAVTLLPLIALLRMLGHDEQQASEISSSSYTLY